MTTFDPSRFVQLHDHLIERIHLTLGHVLALNEQRSDIASSARGEIASAVRKVADLLGSAPEEIPANPRYLRERLERFNAVGAGVSDGRWRNIRSLLGKALKHAGVTSLPGRYVAPISPLWMPLWKNLADRRLRSGLSRLVHWCDAAGIAPEQVNDGVIGRFGAELLSDSMGSRPKAVLKDSCKLWNRAVAEIVGWPKQQVTVPDHRNILALPWDALPASYRTDVDDYLAWAAQDDLLSKGPKWPITRVTRKQRRGVLLKLASALVHSGYCRAEQVTGLRVLVDAKAAAAILRFLHARLGAKTGHLKQMAVLLKNLAVNWVEVEDLEPLSEICSVIKLKPVGMTAKNRRRLLPFEDPKTLQAILRLPDRLVEEAERAGRDCRRAALLVADALAIRLSTFAMLRGANLQDLEIGKTIVRVGHGGDAKLFIIIEAEQVKNVVDLEVDLPPPVIKLFDLYCRKYRPRLLSGPSDKLFPGTRPGTASTNLTRRVPLTIHKHLGLKFNLHLFRHLAAMIHLKANPGDYETVRRVLGHRSLATTMRAYVGLENTAAFRHFDAEILRLIEEPHDE